MPGEVLPCDHKADLILRALGLRDLEAATERLADSFHRAYQPDEGDDMEECWTAAMRAGLLAALSPTNESETSDG